jgi:hypothetical protein
MQDPTVANSHMNALGHHWLAEELYKQLHDQEHHLILVPRKEVENGRP